MKFYTRDGTEFKLPKNIIIRGYQWCPQTTISNVIVLIKGKMENFYY